MLAFSIALPLAAGGLAAFLTKDSMAQYAALAQPPLSPPGWVFPVVWTMLFVLMGAASWRIRQADAPKSEKTRALRLYYAQLAVNFVWPLLFFRAGRYGTAFWWLLLLLALVLATAAAFRKLDRTAARLLAPYIAWLLCAAYLNAGVWQLNG